MANSLDIVLNAIDRTGPAINSAIGNVEKYDAAVSNVGQASGGGGFVSGLVSGLFSVSGALSIAAVGAVALGTALVTNVGGSRDFIVSAFSSIGSWVASTFESIASSVASTIKSMADGTFDWAKLFKSVVTGVVTGFAVIEYSFTHFGQIAELIWTGLAYGLVKFGNEIEYTFTEVIPAVLNWFADNWQDIFIDIWNFTKTVLTNMGENLLNFFDAVSSWLAGDGFDFTWKGLTDGFESSIKELPKIVEREIGPIEQSLGEQFADIGKKVGDGMGENIAKRVAQVPDIMKGISGFTATVGNFFKGLNVGGILKSLFGGDDKKDPGVVLPGLRNERFTTGVTASQESPETAELKVVGKLIGDVLSALGVPLAKPISDGVKAGIEQAKKPGGFMGFNLN